MTKVIVTEEKRTNKLYFILTMMALNFYRLNVLINAKVSNVKKKNALKGTNCRQCACRTQKNGFTFHSSSINTALLLC